MQTALRKMGNSTGMILPRSILGQIGVTTGAAMDLKVEDGRLIVTPITSHPCGLGRGGGGRRLGFTASRRAGLAGLRQ